MIRLLALMLFVYYKYTIHLIPKEIRRGIDITVEEITRDDPEAAEAVSRARSKVELARLKRKSAIVDREGQPISAEKDSEDPF